MATGPAHNTRPRTGGNTGQAATIGWHLEEIRAAIRMRGTTMAGLSRSLGHDPDAVRNAIRCRRSTVVEKLIADFVGVPAPELWPDRYRDGHPIDNRRRRRARRAGTKDHGGEP